MSFREFVKSLAAAYFVIVTLIVFGMYVLGTISHPDAALTYEAFLSPLIYGLLGVLPGFVLYSKKELTVRQFFFRKVLQLICIEAVIVIFSFGAKVLSLDDKPLIFSLMLTVLIVFVVSHVILYLIDMEQARKLNIDLEKFQKRIESENDANQ